MLQQVQLWQLLLLESQTKQLKIKILILNLFLRQIVLYQEFLRQIQILQQNIILQSSQDEYSYIIAPSQPIAFQPQLYTEYQTISHPSIKSNATNILDLEFSNSINEKQEIEQYIQQLGSIFINKQIREDGCQIQNQNKKIQNIYKNETLFLIYVSKIQVCYGDLYNQQNLIVGYLVNSLNSYHNVILLEEIQTETESLLRNWFVASFCIFILIFFCLSVIMIQFLKYNFEIPISILNSFIKEAKPTEIYQFNELLDSGQIKTQYELKVVLQAINQAVLNFKSKITKQIDDLKKCNMKSQLEIYQRAIQDFQIFQNNVGLALWKLLCIQNNATSFQHKCIINQNQSIFQDKMISRNQVTFAWIKAIKDS
ncbi:hypothetical protein ABPG72_001174 [Tetrahymena utriculariae]